MFAQDSALIVTVSVEETWTPSSSPQPSSSSQANKIKEVGCADEGTVDFLAGRHRQTVSGDENWLEVYEQADEHCPLTDSWTNRSFDSGLRCRGCLTRSFHVSAPSHQGPRESETAVVGPLKMTKKARGMGTRHRCSLPGGQKSGSVSQVRVVHGTWQDSEHVPILTLTVQGKVAAASHSSQLFFGQQSFHCRPTGSA